MGCYLFAENKNYIGKMLKLRYKVGIKFKILIRTDGGSVKVVCACGVRELINTEISLNQWFD